MGKKAKENSDTQDDEKKLRIAIVNSDRCKPKKCCAELKWFLQTSDLVEEERSWADLSLFGFLRCKAECKTHCPVVRTGKLCVEAASFFLCKVVSCFCATCFVQVSRDAKISWISETLCIGSSLGLCGSSRIASNRSRRRLQTPIISA